MQGVVVELVEKNALLDVLPLLMEVVEVVQVALTVVLPALHEVMVTNEYLFLDTLQVATTI